jgi:hypothetical protein
MLDFKIGVLVTYDFELLKNSLPYYYEYADTISLAIDSERKTWSGGKFDIPASFFLCIKEFDTKNKISIYEDVFFIPGLSTIACDSRERTLLGKFMGNGGWHIQIDSDEYFLDFPKFLAQLRKIEKRTQAAVTVYMISIPTKLFLLQLPTRVTFQLALPRVAKKYIQMKSWCIIAGPGTRKKSGLN